MENGVRDNQSAVKQHELVLAEQELDKVTVYADRAEVVRFVEVELDRGLNEVRLTNAPSTADGDGVRVEGKGDAAIVEVSLQEHWTSREEEPADSEDLERMQNDLKKFHKEEEVLSKRVEQLSTKGKLFNNYVQSATKFNSDQPNFATVMSDSALQTVTKFLDAVQDTEASIGNELLDANAEKELLRQKVYAIEREIRDLEPRKQKFGHRDVVVLVDANTAGKVRLRVSYVVSGAKWSPTYDVRASSVDSTVQIHYYAMVMQTSGEEWKDAELALSTVKPSISGNLPKLGARFIKFREPVRLQSSHHRDSYYPRSPEGMDYPKTRFCAVAMSDMTHGSATVDDGQFNTAFKIARRTTISSDRNARKVTIAIINVEADLVHKVIPRKSTSAFITAKIRNTSSMPLLAGPSRIFMDNMFVAKSRLDNVGPEENFTCSLGVDPAVRIDYKPLKKFHEQSTGLLSRTQREVYEQATEIVNGRKSTIHLFMEDQLPKSNENQIKVQLLQPQVSVNQQTATTSGSVVSIGNIKANVKHTDEGNIEWEMDLQPNEKLNVPFKYQVDFPVDKEVVEYEKY